MSKALKVKLLSQKLDAYKEVVNSPVPPSGWIQAIRTTLGMSLSQLGKKLGMSHQAVSDYEAREQSGSITLLSLQKAAAALDMKVVYAIVPAEADLAAYIEHRARAKAIEIVKRTATTMQLEDQGLSEESLRDAIAARTKLLVEKMPKSLWD